MNQQIVRNSHRVVRFLLAILTMAVVGFAVYTNRQAERSVRSSLEKHSAALRTISTCDATAAAGTLNTPGNQAFVGGSSIAAHRIDLQERVEVQRAQSAQCRTELQASNPELLPLVDESDELMNLVRRQSEVIFALLEAGESQAAGDVMAGMDEAYARADAVTERLTNALRSAQNKRLRTDAAELKTLATRQTVSTALTALLMIGLIGYGRSQAKAASVSRERAESIRVLEQHQVALAEALTAYERQQQALLAQETLLLNAERMAGMGSWSWDVASDRVLWSKQMCRLFDYPETETPTFNDYISRVHPDDRARAMAIIGQAMQTGQPYTIEHRILRQDGTTVITYAEANLVVEDGKVTHITGIAHDVTDRRKAEQALVDSENRFKLAARATNDLIWDWNVAAGKIWFNEALQTRFGYAVAGELDIDFWYGNVHPDDVERVKAGLKEVLGTDQTGWSGEYRFRHVTGEWRQVCDRGYIVRDQQGKAVRMIGATDDITDRRAAEEAMVELNHRMERILRSAAEGMFGVDREGRVLFINDSGANMLGWTPEELKGRELHTLCHHTRPDGSVYAWQECPAFQAMEQKTSRAAGNELVWRRDGSTLPVALTSSPMIDDEDQVVGAVITMRDITEQRAVEKMKDEFVSTVSHELRTPLTSIRGALGVLSSGRLGEMSEKANRLLEIATVNTDRLVRLINDILDLERIDAAGVHLVKRRTVSGDLVRQAVESVRPLAERKDIKLVSEAASLPVHVDPDRIVQTLTNLIGNAIKFSSQGTTIEVGCSGRADEVLFTVADRGRGIPADKLESVFGRFQQVDSSDAREKGGSGLGLAICRSLVEQHEGRIWAENRPGGGTVFSFTLPTDARVSSASLMAAQSVLICDDDPSAREIIGTLLSGQGYAVREVTSGADLIASALISRPDVILLDLFMPSMNGWETLARLKSDPQLAAVPVVIISVLSPEETGVPVSNFSGWVQKPLVEDALVNALVQALQTSTRRPRLLVIEDDLDLARVIAASFERHGVETIHATNGREAIDLAPRIEPDLIVLDVVLPELDGYGVVAWLRSQKQFRDVPLIVYSALEPNAEQQGRLTLGRTEFLTKSRVSPEDFERRIVRFFDDFIIPATERISRVA